MRMCIPHWDALKLGIKTVGLDALVADSSDDLVSKMTSQSEGVTFDNFDPLMYAHNRILENLMGVGGVAVIIQEGCPICYANDMHQLDCKEEGCVFTYDAWIDKSADEALNVYKKLVG